MSVSESVTKHNSTGFIAVALFCGLLVCHMLGCAKSESQPNNDAATQHQPPEVQQRRDQVAEARPALLHGVWLGGATLDETKLQQKLDSLPPAQQQVALAKARSFLSTLMAIEYRKDGTVENDLEIISVDGQLLRDGSVGNWNVVKQSANQVVVETQEQLSDGSTTTDQFVYHFFEDGSGFSLSVQTDDDLDGCDAMMVFERQMLPPTNVASGGSDTQTK